MQQYSTRTISWKQGPTGWHGTCDASDIQWNGIPDYSGKCAFVSHKTGNKLVFKVVETLKDQEADVVSWTLMAWIPGDVVKTVVITIFND